jgi:hypothetical protein
LLQKLREQGEQKEMEVEFARGEVEGADTAPKEGSHNAPQPADPKASAAKASPKSSPKPATASPVATPQQPATPQTSEHHSMLSNMRHSALAKAEELKKHAEQAAHAAAEAAKKAEHEAEKHAEEVKDAAASGINCIIPELQIIGIIPEMV